jgi:hypothetical protein
MRRRAFSGLIGGLVGGRSRRAQLRAKSFRVAYLALLGDQNATIVKQRLNGPAIPKAGI